MTPDAPDRGVSVAKEVGQPTRIPFPWHPAVHASLANAEEPNHDLPLEVFGTSVSLQAIHSQAWTAFEPADLLCTDLGGWWRKVMVGAQGQP